MTAVLAAALAATFGLLGLAKLAALPPMRSAAAHLGLSVAQYRGIGVLELAGAAGLTIGLTAPIVGIAASTGLVLLMLGAALAHARHGDTLARVGIPLILIGPIAAYAVVVGIAG